MKKMLFLVLLLCGVHSALFSGGSNDWKLVWSDEFNGPTVDTNKWNLIEGGFGGGNDEMQYYSARTENAFVSNGSLVLQAIREKFRGKSFTSAKLTSQDKAEWLYGRFEFSAKLPKGKGFWPAIWMMPTGFKPFWERSAVSMNRYGTWPSCGEIDIMENGGSRPDSVQGTLIFGEPFIFIKRTYTLKDGKKFSDDFHEFAFEWEPGEMRWYVDGELYSRQNRWFGKTRPTSTNFIYPAPFDVKFFLQLNLAVGGNFDGDPDGNTKFPGEMLVDYVRVYQKKQYTPISFDVTNNIPQAIDWSMKFNTNHKVTLFLRAIDFKNNGGQACFLVSKNGLNNSIATVRSAISNFSSSAVIDGLPEGYYMIFVYHDENKNGILDMSPGNPWPVEGSGLAGMIGVSHEPPVFNKYAVVVNDKRTNYTVYMEYDYGGQPTK